MQTKSSSAEPVPLRVDLPMGHRREDQLQIVDPTPFRGNILPGWTVVNRPASSDDRVDTDHRSVKYASKGFRLPKGWAREEVPRKTSYQIDKYYVERATGKRFRSLVSVERYLKESGNRTDQQRMLFKYHRRRFKDFSLPSKWIVEEKPRRNYGHTDKTYIEPGTGNKFRSLAAVERYLHPERFSLVGFQNEAIDPNPPKKVKWVLAGPGGSIFSPYMKGSDVSSSVKQKWSEAFVSVIQDRS